MPVPNKIRVNVICVANDCGNHDKLTGVRKPILASAIIAISQDVRGTVLRLADNNDDLIISETIDDLVKASDGLLIDLMPLGFEDMSFEPNTRGNRFAVNPNFITFKASPKGGSIVLIEGVERGIIVRETPDEIETLIDA